MSPLKLFNVLYKRQASERTPAALSRFFKRSICKHVGSEEVIMQIGLKSSGGLFGSQMSQDLNCLGRMEEDGFGEDQEGL